MKNLYLFALIALLALAALSGCALSPEDESQFLASFAADPSPDPTQAPTNTPSPSPTPSPTLTPTPIPTVLIDGAEYPEDLTVLDLSHHTLADPSGIAQLEYLTDLVLDYSGITDLGFLSEMQSVRTLSLCGNSIEDPSPLYSLTSLEYLDLDDTPLSYKELLAVKEALPECEVVGTFSISISDAKNISGITTQVNGRSIDETALTIYNDTPFAVDVTIPLGTYFGASASVQNMVVRTEEKMHVNPGSSISHRIDTACMNIEKSIPDDSDVMSVKSLDKTSRLARLVEVLSENGCSYDVAQAAIWYVTDNPGDYALLHTLSNGYSDVVNADELALAKQMVALADHR
ncbi:MAG: hypothetical protein LBT59_02380 [Clostridiales bacterium]|jgi:hypothetical protein|nr:hypothetical protein [Clostridiales bacterium]